MTCRRIASFLALALLLLLLPSVASAQLSTGDVFGVVADETGQPLPGVTVTLTGVGGAPKTATTDAQGRFRFIGLYPGDYALRADLEGYSGVEQTGLGVRIGGKVEVQLTMNAALQEVITITAEQPLINPRELSTGPVLTPRELDKLPTARDPWSLLRQAPGVQTDRINVGGSEGGQQSTFFVGGATQADNQFSVDGTIESDMAAIGGSASYYDFGAYEEVQITTASTDVTIQTAGVTINQVTKRGTNTWKGDARYLSTEGGWQEDPKEVNGNAIDQVEEYGLNIGGPLMRDHLWVWGAYGESDIGLFAQGGQLDRTELNDLNAKVNFQAGNTTGFLHYWDNDKLKNGRNAGPSFAPESTWDQTTPAEKWKGEITHLFGSNFALTGLYSINDGGFTLHPQGGNDADVFYNEDGVWTGSFWVFDQTATIEQGRLDASSYFDTGSVNHELRFGAGFREQENDSISVLPGSGQAILSGEGWLGIEGDLELVEWSRHTVAVTTNYDSFWAQDTLSFDRLTLTAGLRYDKQTAHNDPVHDPGNPEVPNGLFPEINFAGDDAGGLEWESLVPRLGLTYALGEQRRTLLRGTFSQYAAQLGQWVPNFVSPTAPYSYVYYYFNDTNGNNHFDPDEAPSLYYYYVYNVNLADPTASANRLQPGLDPYMTDEVTLSMNHAFENNIGFSVTASYRNTSDLLEARTLIFDENGNERLATRDDYVLRGPTEGILPDGTVVSVPRYRLAPDLSATGGKLLVNGDREIEYWGINLGLVKPMANRWSMRGNFTYGETDFKVGPEFLRYDDPTDVISLGSLLYGDDSDIFLETSYGSKRLVTINSAWTFNINAIYQVAPDRPWSFNLAGSITGREGYPFVPGASRSAHTRQLSPNLDDFRFDDVYTFDAHIDKDFRLGEMTITASLDGFNLLNDQPVLQRNPFAPAPEDGLEGAYPVEERLSPRVFRWGLKFAWR